MIRSRCRVGQRYCNKVQCDKVVGVRKRVCLAKYSESSGDIAGARTAKRVDEILRCLASQIAGGVAVRRHRQQFVGSIDHHARTPLCMRLSGSNSGSGPAGGLQPRPAEGVPRKNTSTGKATVIPPNNACEVKARRGRLHVPKHHSIGGYLRAHYLATAECWRQYHSATAKQ